MPYDYFSSDGNYSEPEFIACNSCNGDGQYTITFENDVYDEVCNFCSGSGVIENYNYIEKK